MALDFTITEVRNINEHLPADGDPGGIRRNGRDASVGAKMRMELDIEVTGDIGPDQNIQATFNTTRIRFNPALFNPSGLALRLFPYADVGYMVEVPTVISPGDIFPMGLVTPPAARESSMNMSCKLVIRADGEHATIVLNYRMSMDLGNHITGGAQVNHNRFLKTHVAAPSEILNTVGSVYKLRTSTFGWRLEIEDGYGVKLAKFGSDPCQARWYNGKMPEYDVDLLEEYEPIAATCQAFRNALPVTNLSAYEKTQVVFTIPVANYTLMDKAFVYVIDLDAVANDVDFLTNYGSQGVEIVPDPATALVGERIYSPTEAGAIGAGGYKVSFWVGGVLDPQRDYGVIVVVPIHSGGDDHTWTTSHIQAFPADALPPTLPVTIEGTIEDYNVDAETDNVISTVVDHLRCRVTVDTATYDAAAAGSTFASTWDQDLLKIRCQVIDQATNTVMFERLFVRDTVGWTGLNGGDNVPIETVNGTEREYAIELHMCMENMANLPDFAGKTLRFRWAFVMYYNVAAWVVEYQYDQRVSVKDFAVFTEVIESVKLFNFATGLPLITLCPDCLVLVEVQLNTVVAEAYAPGSLWNLRAYWQLEPYGYLEAVELRPAGVGEEEGYASGTGFDQLDDALFDAVPATFDGSGRAVFSFDACQVPVGQRARLYVIAEPVAAPVVPDPCDGPYLQFVSSNAAVTLGNSRSSTGYITVVNGGGSLTLGVGNPLTFITGAMPVNPTPEDGFCVYCSEADGTPTPAENITYLTISAQGLTSCTGMETDQVVMLFIDLSDNAMDETSVDHVLNTRNSALNSGLVELSGASMAAPTAASAAAIVALNANGWAVSTE